MLDTVFTLVHPADKAMAAIAIRALRICANLIGWTNRMMSKT